MRILLIDDNSNYSDKFVDEVAHQYIVDTAYSAEDGVFMSEVNDYDAILVNINSNTPDYYNICKDTRDANVKSPIVVLADKPNSALHAQLLNDGADACLYQPYCYKHVSAQINALVRRSVNMHRGHKLKCGTLVLDQDAKEAHYAGRKLDLRRKEFELLEYLAINIGKIVPKEKLLEHVWCEGVCVNSNSLEVHIRAIRKKLLFVESENSIKTVKGIGYRLEYWVFFTS